MNRMRPCILLATAFALSASAHSAAVPAGDPRIRIVRYDATDVVEITAYPGFQQAISFSPAERIQTASIGDSASWQVTPNAAANKLFLKPLGSRAHTNLTVVTDRRTYNFELVAAAARASGATTYEVRFEYPSDGAAQADVLSIAPAVSAAKAHAVTESAPTPESWNLDYSFRGERDNAPLHVLDDGHFTWFEFRANAALPAIFAVEQDRHESLVNFHLAGKYVVVERLAHQFTLRGARGVVCVFNKAEMAEASRQAPRP